MIRAISAFIIVGLALVCPAHAINSVLILRQSSAVPPTGDAFFSPNGTDVAGNTIGTNCTYAAPCKTVSKALTFLAANIAGAPGANRSYSLLFDGGNGPFYLSSELIATPAHTVASGYTTTFGVYNGNTAYWSAGVDTAGTWQGSGYGVNAFGGAFTATTGAGGLVTLPSGGAACVSTALVSEAPLSNSNISYMVGEAWVNGLRTQETQRPVIGSSDLAAMPGTPGGATVGASVHVGPTANIASSNTAIAITDLSQLGQVGDPIAFDTAVGNIEVHHPYYIEAKAANTGSGNITISTDPTNLSTTIITPSASNSADPVQDPVQENNEGDWNDTSGQNVFQSNSSYTGVTSYNQTDVKIWFGSEPTLVPVAQALSTGACAGGITAPCIAVNTRSQGPSWSFYPGTRYQVWNRFDDLGGSSIAGELYTDRTSGLIFYTPRTGETCASFNSAGTFIIPGPTQELLKITNSVADAGSGLSGQAVGRMTFNDIMFEHTNSSIWTGKHVVNGAVGGYTTGSSQHYAPSGKWAVTGIGASYVTFNGACPTSGNFCGGARFLAGNGFGFSWGSNHITIENTEIQHIGGAAWTGGATINTFDATDYQIDPGYYGTASYGPTTPSFYTGGDPQSPVDPTGNSDCCHTISNNKIHDIGEVNASASALGNLSSQGMVLDHNTIYNSPSFIWTNANDSVIGSSAPSYNGMIQGVLLQSAYRAPGYNNTISNNEMYHCGYTTVWAQGGPSIIGTPIPGGSMFNDFGCLYNSSPQDGNGTQTGEVVFGNKVHDSSAGAYTIVEGASTSDIHTSGYDSSLLYCDQNDCGGMDVYNNWFYDLPYTAVGDGTHATYPTRGWQITGNQRSVYHNNILFVNWPSGWTTGGTTGCNSSGSSCGFQPLVAITPGWVWLASHSYGSGSFIVNATTKNMYSSNTSVTTGSAPPTCTTGTCSGTGDSPSNAWTYLGAYSSLVPGNTYGTWTNNIFAEQIGSGGSGTQSDSNWWALGGAQGAVGSPYFAFSNNMYSNKGYSVATFSTGTPGYSFSSWITQANPAGGDEDADSYWGGSGITGDAAGNYPNFNSPLTGDLTFASSYSGPGSSYSCSLGGASPACNPAAVNFTPFSLTNVGAH